MILVDKLGVLIILSVEEKLFCKVKLKLDIWGLMIRSRREGTCTCKDIETPLYRGSEGWIELLNLKLLILKLFVTLSCEDAKQVQLL